MVYRGAGDLKHLSKAQIDCSSDMNMNRTWCNMAKLTTGEKVHATFMLCVAAGIALSVVFAVASLLSTESVVVSLDSGGTAYIERRSYLGIRSKNHIARVRKGEWESKLVSERFLWSLTAVDDQPWKRIIFIDQGWYDGEN